MATHYRSLTRRVGMLGILLTTCCDVSQGQSPSNPDNSAVHLSGKGPWGLLESFPVFLEAPLSLVRKFNVPGKRTEWKFPEAEAVNMEGRMLECGFTPEQVQQVLSASGNTVGEGLIHYFPPKDLVKSLIAEVRGRFYDLLGRVAANVYHADPALIVEPPVEKWFASSGVRKEILELIAKLSYPRGGIVAFADMELVLGETRDNDEALAVLKALTRTRAQMVKLLLPRDSDVESLVDYWSTGANLRRKDIEPILRAVANTPGAEKLDIVHLLPATARKYLMTYPDKSLARYGIFPDCHWTSLNFFNYAEEAHLLDSRLATTAVLERFERVEPPYRYGDIVFFLSKTSGNAYHSCVYLADDLVYTKNGRSELSPWIISTIADVEKLYLYRGNGRLQGYRIRKTARDSSD